MKINEGTKGEYRENKWNHDIKEMEEEQRYCVWEYDEEGNFISKTLITLDDIHARYML